MQTLHANPTCKPYTTVSQALRKTIHKTLIYNLMSKFEKPFSLGKGFVAAMTEQAGTGKVCLMVWAGLNRVCSTVVQWLFNGCSMVVQCRRIILLESWIDTFWLFDSLSLPLCYSLSLCLFDSSSLWLFLSFSLILFVSSSLPLFDSSSFCLFVSSSFLSPASSLSRKKRATAAQPLYCYKCACWIRTCKPQKPWSCCCGAWRHQYQTP